MSGNSKFGAKALAIAALLAAGGWSAAVADEGHGHGAAIGKPGTAGHVSRTVTVTLGDNFFEPKSIAVKAGETIRFVVINKGELVHEFNIGTVATHAQHQKEMMMMQDMGAIDGDRIDYAKMQHMDMGDGRMMKHDDPNSVLLEPGKTGQVIWTFPQSGALEFACNVPGHYQAGMMGRFEFE